jgi:hypothetical protein
MQITSGTLTKNNLQLEAFNYRGASDGEDSLGVVDFVIPSDTSFIPLLQLRAQPITVEVGVFSFSGLITDISLEWTDRKGDLRFNSERFILNQNRNTREIRDETLGALLNRFGINYSGRASEQRLGISLQYQETDYQLLLRVCRQFGLILSNTLDGRVVAKDLLSLDKTPNTFNQQWQLSSLSFRVSEPPSENIEGETPGSVGTTRSLANTQLQTPINPSTGEVQSRTTQPSILADRQPIAQQRLNTLSQEDSLRIDVEFVAVGRPDVLPEVGSLLEFEVEGQQVKGIVDSFDFEVGRLRYPTLSVQLFGFE